LGKGKSDEFGNLMSTKKCFTHFGYEFRGYLNILSPDRNSEVYFEIPNY